MSLFRALADRIHFHNSSTIMQVYRWQTIIPIYLQESLVCCWWSTLPD